jgi:AcrR family transcriptional regulator
MKLRADAARNREAIVEAARAVFAESGLDAPLDDIAKRAGTGNATLYRRFPTRADLIAAVFAERMAEHVEAVEAALADSDAWSGFAGYLRAAGAMQARDRGIADLVTMDLSAAPEVEQLRARAYDGLVRLVAHAQAAGVLRADFTHQDVVLLLMANAGLVERAYGMAGDASARLIALLLDGMRAPAATAGPAAPSASRVLAAMEHNGRSRLGCAARTTPSPPATTGKDLT